VNALHRRCCFSALLLHQPAASARCCFTALALAAPPPLLLQRLCFQSNKRLKCAFSIKKKNVWAKPSRDSRKLAELFFLSHVQMKSHRRYCFCAPPLAASARCCFTALALAAPPPLLLQRPCFQSNKRLKCAFSIKKKCLGEAQP
jgi:hypothetical protein